MYEYYVSNIHMVLVIRAIRVIHLGIVHRIHGHGGKTISLNIKPNVPDDNPNSPDNPLMNIYIHSYDNPKREDWTWVLIISSSTHIAMAGKPNS